jgi:predicted PurR-regulated permease PerM
VPRVISFIVLLAIILLVGAVFFQVMAQFLVPLFLASVLLVVFQPLHARILGRLPKYPRLAALITTVLILLAVLLPLVWLGWNAYGELRTLVPAEKHIVDAPAAPSTPTDTTAPDTTAAIQKPGATHNDPKLGQRLHDSADKLRIRINELTRIDIEEKYVQELVDRAQSFLATKALSGVQSAIGILIGLAIMVIALYYFLADGPTMIETVMDLSPLDARYEQELLERFGDVSRAVVVATLLSALVQGALAGIGYYFALPVTAPIFLLTAVTMVTALVPFVGAAASWICVAGWVYLYGERVVDGQLVQGDPKTAIILAIYCTIVVSGIDNVIKPFILHGQSKLHPLLALLSILGGVQVLGPVGILVGPMLVSFLQALLNMLRKELDSFSGPVVDGTKPLATSVAEAIQQAVDENDDKGAKAQSPPATGAVGRAGRAKRKR